MNQLIESELDYLDALGHSVDLAVWKIIFGRLHNIHSRECQVHTFLNRMDLAYAAADIVISRAGASSVSELCVVGKPVIFIPSPNVSEDHQTKNALAVSEKKAAIL